MASTRPTRSATGSMPTPPSRTGTRLSAELSRLSPMTNRWPIGTTVSGHIIERLERRELEDRVLAVARQRLDQAHGRRSRAILVFHLTGSVRLQRGGFAVDPHLSIAQCDMIAGQADHAFDAEFGTLARPAKDNHIATLR